MPRPVLVVSEAGEPTALSLGVSDAARIATSVIDRTEIVSFVEDVVAIALDEVEAI